MKTNKAKRRDVCLPIRETTTSMSLEIHKGIVHFNFLWWKGHREEAAMIVVDSEHL